LRQVEGHGKIENGHIYWKIVGRNYEETDAEESNFDATCTVQTVQSSVTR
jgi:hypothetical protein